MVFTSSFALGLIMIFLAPVSSSMLYGRDLDGTWKRLSWEKRANPGDVLKLPLVNNNDQSYSVPVRMGTPFQEIQMAVSLSQNHIIVASPDTSDNTGFYNQSRSSSYTPGNASTVVRGNDGQTTTANFARESCQVSDFNYNASVAIAPASANIDQDIFPKGCHGVLGYGVDAPPTAPNDSSLLGVYLPPHIPSAVCGIELNWNGDANPGIFTMGGIDSSAFSGDFTKMIVPPATSIDRPSWSIPVDSIHAAVDNGVQSIAGNVASIDPYYPNVELPADAVQQLYSKISNSAVAPDNSNRYTVPCNAKIQLTMVFGGRNFTMDPRDAITNENGTCYGTVQATVQANSSSGNLYKIGSPFMRNVYTSFGADFNATGPTFNVAFATKVLRTGARSANSGTSSKPSLSAALVVLTCIYMIAA